MNVIPVELHITILIFLAGFAATRRTKAPLFLTTMYAALFILATYTQNLALEYSIDYRSQALFASLLTWLLISYAYRMKRSVFVDGFLCFSFFAIINTLVMFLAYTNLTGSLYVSTVGLCLTLEFLFQMVDIIMLMGIINGDPARDIHIDFRQFSLRFNSVFSSRLLGKNQKAPPWSQGIKRSAGHR
jgi:hypothetical protein